MTAGQHQCKRHFFNVDAQDRDGALRPKSGTVMLSHPALNPGIGRGFFKSGVGIFDARFGRAGDRRPPGQIPTKNRTIMQ
jgi:hypothetical protein